MPWPEVVECALDQSRDHSRTLGTRNKITGGDWTLDDVIYALRVAARRLRQETLSLGEYEQEWQTLAREGPFPTANQIRYLVGTWRKAVELAGLSETRSQPLASLSIEDVIEHCLDRHGTLLTRAELPIYARAQGLNVRRRARRWSESISLVRERRDSAGLQTPLAPPPLNDRPNYAQSAGVERVVLETSRRYSREECVAALARFLAELPAGRRPTQRAYRDWAKGKPATPTASTLQRFGRLEALLEEARALQA
jgi:hypothetical protein